MLILLRWVKRILTTLIFIELHRLAWQGNGVSGSNSKQLLFQIFKPDACNYGSGGVRYSSLTNVSLLECLAECGRTEGCGLVLHSAEVCYLQNGAGSNLGDAGCSKCVCFRLETKNVAQGSRCVASSEHSAPFACERAVNGIHTEPGWASLSQGVGAWIQLDFDRPYFLTYARFLPRQATADRNKDILLEFSDGSNQQFQLPDQPNGYFWTDVTLVPVMTSWVKVTVLSVYNKKHNGFTEIEMYGF